VLRSRDYKVGIIKILFVKPTIKFKSIKHIQFEFLCHKEKTTQRTVIHFGSCNYSNTEIFHIRKLYSLLYCKLHTELHVSAVWYHQINLQTFHTSKTPIYYLHKRVYDTWLLAILHYKFAVSLKQG
jgi:hypothetical protein